MTSIKTFATRLRDFWHRGQIQELRSLQEVQKQQMLLQRFLALPDGVLTFPYYGQQIRLSLPNADVDYLQKQVLLHRTFFEEPHLRLVRDRFDLRGKWIVDAGANIGNHTVYFSKVCGAERVVAFEPSPYTADILSTNVAINNLEGVEVVRKGLSSKSGLVSFLPVGSSNIGGASYREGGPDGIEVMTLDAMELPRCDLIKADVQGMADLLIEGARSTLRKHLPHLYIELVGEEYNRSVTILDSLGYNSPDALGYDNYLFTHPQRTDAIR